MNAARIAARALTSLAVLAPAVPAADFGHFEGRPQLEWQDDGRTMVLLQPFTYVDPKNQRWTSGRGASVDGASIPRVVWSIVGGPYEGRYRNASVPHDTECDAESRPWRDVHRMFYNGMRAGGVKAVKASLMYGAVYFFGPRWKVEPQPAWAAALDPSQKRDFLERLLVVLRREARLQEPRLEDIETKTYAGLKQDVPDNDPDLKRVRSLIENRNAALLAPASALQRSTVERIDRDLFLESDESTTAPALPRS